ncbi:DUF2946 family protein [Sphingomonas nostoxanthinifaciens]|uniref:DUF2946 family protein n=1 Tax=Sphingomonas nostoxanthinifaciens TaxID=2872652 RepID=UPI001CC20194|nr:DUF2946 family protein [Sphingomonas nostoxanthinifaciens]UAK25249.1 DUF2946 family protein [Sphingomonas nostoxanthinifaciens]
MASLAAMLFFAFAVAKSDLMQIAMAAPAATICADMAPGATNMATPHASHAEPDRSHAACLYCDTAAHPPLIAAALLVPEPWTVAWIPALPAAPHGPRGPPQPRAKARAPPSLLIV